MIRKNESIDFLDLDTLDLENQSVVFKYLLSKKGLLTNCKSGECVFRYSKYDKDPRKVDELVQSIVKYVSDIYKTITNIDPDAKLGYVYNDLCVNLRVQTNIKKDDLYRLLISVCESVFNKNNRISYITESADAFRIVRSKKYFSPGERPYTILIVVGFLSAKMDAFIKEQEIAEDLYLYKTNPTKYHFKNSHNIFDNLNLDYDPNEIFVPNSRTRRINPENPFENGKFNFITDSNGKIGSIIADIVVRNKYKDPTYISVKSFGRNLQDKVHLTTIKYDYNTMYSSNHHSAALLIYSLIKNNINEITELYKKTNGDIKICSKYILENAIIDPDCKYIQKMKNLSLFDSLSDYEKLEYVRYFLDNPLFHGWGINPFRYIETFATYEKEENNNLSVKDYYIDKITDERIICNIEHFLLNAWGYGYILVSAKNRMLYYKDYRDHGLDPIDYKLKTYTIVYPKINRNSVKLICTTENIIFSGEMHPGKTGWPDTIVFFYYYKNLEKFFEGTICNIINPIFMEGFLMNRGFKKEKPD